MMSRRYNIATILLSTPSLIPNAQFHYGCHYRNSFTPGIRYERNVHHRNATPASFTCIKSHHLGVRLVQLLPSPRHEVGTRCCSPQRAVGQGDNTALGGCTSSHAHSTHGLAVFPASESSAAPQQKLLLPYRPSNCCPAAGAVLRSGYTAIPACGLAVLLALENKNKKKTQHIFFIP